jgi:hypothetical protein
MDRPQIDRRITEIVAACKKKPFLRWRVLKQLQYPIVVRWMTAEDREDVRSRIGEP